MICPPCLLTRQRAQIATVSTGALEINLKIKTRYRELCNWKSQSHFRPCSIRRHQLLIPNRTDTSPSKVPVKPGARRAPPGPDIRGWTVTRASDADAELSQSRRAPTEPILARGAHYHPLGSRSCECRQPSPLLPRRRASVCQRAGATETAMPRQVSGSSLRHPRSRGLLKPGVAGRSGLAGQPALGGAFKSTLARVLSLTPAQGQATDNLYNSN